MKSLSWLLMCIVSVPVQSQSQPQSPEVWTASLIRTVGGPGSAVEFGSIADLTVDGSASVYVLDRYEPFIYVFDSTGRFLRRGGTAGSGPGELRSVRRLGWTGDSLWISDPSQGRIVIFDRALKPERTLSFRPSLGRQFIAGLPEAVLPNAGVMVVALESSPPTANHHLAPAPLALRMPLSMVSRSGQVTSTVLTMIRSHDQMSVKITFDGAPGLAAPEQPFSLDPLWRVARDGSSAVVLNYRMSPQRAGIAVTRVSPEGDTLFAVQFDLPTRRLTNADVEAAVRKVQAQLPKNHTIALDVEDFKRQLYRPPFAPMIDAIVKGRDNTVWLRIRPATDDRTAEHWVLDQTGRLIRKLSLPVEDQLMEADGNRVWTISAAAFGEPVLRIYQIRRS